MSGTLSMHINALYQLGGRSSQCLPSHPKSVEFSNLGIEVARM
jgi:hypothetical protein